MLRQVNHQVTEYSVLKKRHKLVISQNVKTHIFHSFKLLHAKTKVVGNCNSSIFYAARNGKRKRERERPGNENKKKLGLNHGFGRSLSPQKLVAPNYLSELRHGKWSLNNYVDKKEWVGGQ